MSSNKPDRGFCSTLQAIIKTGLSGPIPPEQIQYSFDDPERHKLHEAIVLSRSSGGDIPELNDRFVSAVAITNAELDRRGIPLSSHSRSRLADNVSAVAANTYGPTLGHATEVATFVSEAGLALRNGNPNTFGEAVVGIAANTLGALGAGHQENMNRKLGRW